MTTTVRHPDRLAEQINIILADPKSWDQKVLHSPCGTKHCIAGHGQIAAGKPMNIPTCKADAQAWYGLTSLDAKWLFRRDRTLTELHGFAMAALASEAYFDSGGYDRAGFGRSGFDRDGVDSLGYARDGYDRYCFDRYGYARDGYHRDGYDHNGYDRNGYSIYGYNRKGYNRKGYNRDGYNRNGDILPLLKIAAGGTP